MNLEVDRVSCRVCGCDSRQVGRVRILKHHVVRLWDCPQCRFCQTDEPWWLEEAYRDPINRFDTGVVGRVLWSGKVVRCLVALAFDARGRFLDFGGGYGLFVRHIRDSGLDFRWEDRFCANLLALGFEAEPTDKGFELVTAFEVLEHVVNPPELIRHLLGRSQALLLSTQLAPDDSAEFVRWSYLGTEHGQHVSFFRIQTFRWLAKSMGVYFVSNGTNLHLFSHRPVPRWKLCCASHPRAAWLAGKLFRWRSLTLPDQDAMKRAAGVTDSAA